MRSRPLMTLRLNTAAVQNIGATPHGTRVTFPITGGYFEGERLRGKVLPGGDDWTLTRSDGVSSEEYSESNAPGHSVLAAGPRIGGTRY